tara:strand:+ start:285 stop:467 length:183 start_codon:yes stop_codon:yes gene_type:complete
MIISKAKYQKQEITNGEFENSGIVTTIDDQEMFVPLDPANRHYQAIQEWVSKGNTIEEAD